MRETRMQSQKEMNRINRFVDFISPVVIKALKMELQSVGLQVEQEGEGLDAVFSIKKDSKQVKMYLQNLLLEIATVDRDEKPLRFDEKLLKFDFFLAKTAQLLASKLKVLLCLLYEEDVNTGLEKITKMALDKKQYERVRIWQIDPVRNKTSNPPEAEPENPEKK